MKFRPCAKVLGVILMFFSLSMLTPVLISLHYHEHNEMPFWTSFGITFATGLLLWLWGQGSHAELRSRDGFLVVFLIWAVLGIYGALPFWLSPQPHLSWSDCLFECISGLTTTGATAIANIDSLPMSILYYRQQLQFLGGMGIIVLAVAIMPLIGVGGMQLYKAETTGPMKDNKLTPRITETAKALWIIYVGLNVLCALCYWAGGMSVFDAVCYAFSTISTGGYAPHNASIAYYPHAIIYIISMVFMILGGTNFSLHFVAFHRLNLKTYWHDSEFKAYVALLLILGLVTSIILFIGAYHHHLAQSILNGYYQVVSFMTTTGFVSDMHYNVWPLFLPVMLLLIGMIGACAGSTTGGVKVIRVVLFHRQIGREINRLIHPSGMFPLKLGNQVVPDRVMSGVWAFLAAYVSVFLIFWLLLMATGMDIVSAFSALATCISNTGPGLGEVSANFGTISATARWVLSLAMLLGRLEVFTILVLLSPAFWRR